MSDDDWVKVALVDGAAVAELLLRMKEHVNSSNLPAAEAAAAAAAAASTPLGWSVRQRRSKPVVLPSSTGKGKQAASTTSRASPTTPLSWSGATSGSGGGGAGDGFEESSRPPLGKSDVSRSKVVRAGEATPSKRPRKKKTLAELKEDETQLLKERRHLKRQLATLRIKVEKQRTENTSLKKMKLSLQPQPENLVLKAVGPDENQTHQNALAVSDSVQPVALPSIRPNLADESPKPAMPSNEVEGQKEQKKSQEDKFVLPDLNEPLGEDFISSEALSGTS